MKIIDLLNKIANGEEVPKRIKYENDTYIHIDNYCYYCDKTNLILSDRIFTEYSKLNDEVEILDEEFEDIEEIENIYAVDHKWQQENNKIFKDKINELIKNQKKIIEQLNYTEELENEIKHLKEEMKYREQDIEDNYKRINVEEQL